MECQQLCQALALEPADSSLSVMPAVTAYQHITVAQKRGFCARFVLYSDASRAEAFETY
jgi:hypothetical protein